MKDSIAPTQGVSDLLASPLSYIYNLSFSTGIFPDSLNLAKILPIFKNDDPFQFNDYRPISILPCFSNVFEKIVYSRLSQYLLKFIIVSHHQYGFRQLFSRHMAILEIVENIFQGFYSNEFTIGIFVDLKKAFDFVNHKIHLNKLYFYSIRGLHL